MSQLGGLEVNGIWKETNVVCQIITAANRLKLRACNNEGHNIQ
jgi:hypothetical protein